MSYDDDTYIMTIKDIKEAVFSHFISGLARQCPKCNTIAHYEIKGRKAHTVECPLCGFEFSVKKYRRGERPKAKNISLRKPK